MKVSFETLKTLIEERKEPSWLTSQRKAAWKEFEVLPFPTTRDELWKYTDLKGFDLQEFEVKEDSFSVTLKGLTEQDKQKGVIFCDIKTAIQKSPLVLETIAQKIKDSTKTKFEHLHQAFWNNGIFIYVPKSVTVEKPLHCVTTFKDAHAMIFPFTIIVVEPFGSVNVIDEMVSKESETKQFSNAARYVWIKEEAQVQYATIQRWGEKVYHFETQYAELEKTSRFSSVHVGLGSQLTKANVHTTLVGAEAEATLLGVFLAHGKQHFDYYTTQDHEAESTQSNLLFKTALRDYAESSYQGIIRIPKHAQKSNAYQANKNLLLSEHSKARSIPKLEIIADDVRCTHSATMGTLDETETFYLRSRGLSHEEAQKMIVRGFFEEAIEKIPSEEIREMLHETIEARLE